MSRRKNQNRKSGTKVFGEEWFLIGVSAALENAVYGFESYITDIVLGALSDDVSSQVDFEEWVEAALRNGDYQFFETVALILKRRKAIKAEGFNAYADPLGVALLICYRELLKERIMSAAPEESILPTFRAFMESLQKQKGVPAHSYDEKKLREICTKQLGMKFRPARVKNRDCP